MVDDNLPTPPFGQPCGGSSCGGVLTCTPQGTVECTGVTCNTPNCMEVCNGQDDDCDGNTDEGTLAGSCTDCCTDVCCKFDTQGNCLEDCTAYQDIGECDFGDLICQAGGFTCVGYIGPKPEICDGKDNDCDGMVDDGATCTGGAVCQGGECVLPCVQSEFPCPAGLICRDVPNCGQPPCKFCFTDPCNGVSCPSGQQCDHDDGTCKDLCDGVMCPTGTQCMSGVCQDCTTLGCATGQRCVVAPGGLGVCETDKCFGVTCPMNQFCNAGTCTPFTCTPACDPNEACFNGQCVPDLCSGKTCGTGKRCDPQTGGCVDDPCPQLSCGRDQICDPNTGACIVDPCTQVSCPTGTVCENTSRGPTCQQADDPGYYVTTGGGGGCSAGGSPGSAMLLAFAGLALHRRRRPRA